MAGVDPGGGGARFRLRHLDARGAGDGRVPGFGKPRILIWTNAIYVAVLLAAMALLLPRLGIVGAAWAFLIAASVNLPLQLMILKGVLGLPPILWLRRVWRPAVAATVMHLSVTALQIEMPTAQGMVDGALELVAVVGAGAVSYVAVVLGLWLMAGRPPGPERYILDRLADVRRRLTAAPSGGAGN